MFQMNKTESYCDMVFSFISSCYFNKINHLFMFQSTFIHGLFQLKACKHEPFSLTCCIVNASTK